MPNDRPPFVEFGSGTTTIDPIVDPAYKRTMGMVHRASELVMLVEASNNNWMNQAASSTYPYIWCGRMGARHGKKTSDGSNAFTNLAFFDGHVALYPIQPFVIQAPAGIPGAANPDNNLVSFTRDTIFYMNRAQRGGFR